jgi:hypothetical protein
VAITNGYCTLAEVKSALRLTDNVDDGLLENAIEGASRRIDGYCGRFFYQTTKTVTTAPRNEYLVYFPQDVATSNGLVLKGDTAGDGSYATTYVLGTDYFLDPQDASIQNRPFRRAVMRGGATFPLFFVPAPPTIQITATFGWPSIPDDVREACILLSMRQFARLNAALGVVGFADMAISVRSVDPDVRDLLNHYKVIGAI